MMTVSARDAKLLQARSRLLIADSRQTARIFYGHLFAPGAADARSLRAATWTGRA